MMELRLICIAFKLPSLCLLGDSSDNSARRQTTIKRRAPNDHSKTCGIVRMTRQDERILRAGLWSHFNFSLRDRLSI